LDKCETHGKEGLRSLEKEEIEDLKRGLLWHVVGKDTDEPLKGKDRGVKAKRGKL
jgi:hypothetical protein